MKTTVIYIIIVGILFISLLAILNIGEKIKAPPKISGKWELSPQFVDSVKKSCTPLHFNQTNTALIEQSGVYITITFDDKLKTKMNGKIIKKESSLNETRKTKEEFEEMFFNEMTNRDLILRLVYTRELPDQLYGTWENHYCDEFGIIKFSAHKKY
jgi:hypothetical protein